MTHWLTKHSTVQYCKSDSRCLQFRRGGPLRRSLDCNLTQHSLGTLNDLSFYQTMMHQLSCFTQHDKIVKKCVERSKKKSQKIKTATFCLLYRTGIGIGSTYLC